MAVTMLSAVRNEQYLLSVKGFRNAAVDIK
jgi:hypothetical protein